MYFLGAVDGLDGALDAVLDGVGWFKKLCYQPRYRKMGMGHSMPMLVFPCCIHIEVVE